jgi:hypothetical protein
MPPVRACVKIVNFLDTYGFALAIDVSRRHGTCFLSSWICRRPSSRAGSLLIRSRHPFTVFQAGVSSLPPMGNGVLSSSLATNRDALSRFAPALRKISMLRTACAFISLRIQDSSERCLIPARGLNIGATRPFSRSFKATRSGHIGVARCWRSSCVISPR